MIITKIRYNANIDKRHDIMYLLLFHIYDIVISIIQIMLNENLVTLID